MNIRQPALTTRGALLTVLLISISHSSAQYQTASPAVKTLYTFKGPPSDGAITFAGVAIGSGGVLYGTTCGGGNAADPCYFGTQDGWGTVFSLTPPVSPGEPWTEKTLHNFTLGSDGGVLIAGVVIGSGGVLYGTTYFGGSSSCDAPAGCGTVFSLTPPTSPGGSWIHRVLHNFAGGSDGTNPTASVVIGSGAIYGTTFYGGSSGCHDSLGCGTVFSLTPPTTPGGSWNETVLHNFTGGGDGAHPYAGVEIGRGGVLYGTTLEGGTGSACTSIDPGCGTVFSLTPPISPGGTWTHRVLHSFAGDSDGASPYAGVTIGSGGVLHGTTRGNLSGTAGYGTVFSLTPLASMSGSWTHRVLHSFTGGSDGANPYAGVVAGWNGVLYGTTYSGGSSCSSCGTVFSLTPPVFTGGTWTERTLYNFVGGNDGATPYAGVVIGSGSVLYGTTQSGGAYCGTCTGPHGGTVFSLKYRLLDEAE